MVLNPAHNLEQTVAAIQHVSAKCIVASAQITPPYKEARSNVELVNHLVEMSKSPSPLDLVIVADAGSEYLSTEVRDQTTIFSSLLDSEQVATELLPHVSSNDVLNLQFTSGTTSAPKAVSLTHKGVLNNAIHIGERMGFSHIDVVCCPFPLFHCSGLVVGLLATLLNGKFATHFCCVFFSVGIFANDEYRRNRHLSLGEFQPEKGARMHQEGQSNRATRRSHHV